MPKVGAGHVKHTESFSEPFLSGPESSRQQSYGTFSAQAQGHLYARASGGGFTGYSGEGGFSWLPIRVEGSLCVFEFH